MKPQQSVSLRDRATVALRCRDPRGDWAPDWLGSCESLTQLYGTLNLKLIVHADLLSATPLRLVGGVPSLMGPVTVGRNIMAAAPQYYRGVFLYRKPQGSGM